MSMRDDLANARIMRANIIDKVTMGEADCTACRAGKLLTLLAGAAIIGAGIYAWRKTR